VPEDTPLFFAVLDGQSPGDWQLFGTKFGSLIKEAKQKAKPTAVGPELLDIFDIYIEPMLKSPADLLKASRLDLLAGVIMDAMPKPDGTDDLDERLNTFHKHVLKVRAVATNNSNPLFRRIGYEMWFITDDPNKLNKQVKQAYNSASMLSETTVSHYFLSSKEAFIDHVASYLSNVYLKMYRGS
jgi:hypothetical protein